MPDEMKTENEFTAFPPADVVNGKSQQFTVWKPPRYRCPTHGIIDQAVTSFIPGYEGHWCLCCVIDMVERNGVHKIEKVLD